MSPRFPAEEANTESAIDAVQQALSTMHKGPPPFKYVDDDGKSPLACYAPFSYTPEMCKQFFVMGKLAYGDQNIKPRNRELAIAGLCSVLDVPFVVYSHRAIAKKVGLSHEQFEVALAGKVPSGLSDEEQAAYRLGRTFTALTGRLDDDTWLELRSHLDKTEIVGLMHVIGGYRWVALLEQVNGDFQDWKD
ncbi:AhpD-like protein [Hypoxylon sp. NC1633]|nr:AhpD-like protein [Hypoxylon sp. NC1633]